MSGTFFGLNIGVKGLAAQQRALDITGHNISNANTEGYTRQEVVMQSSLPMKTSSGFVGTGVDINNIRRMRDGYLDLQVRTENTALGRWDFRSDILDKIEVIVNEPSDAGLRTTMDKFWSAWEDLSRKPESSAVRTTVIETGEAVIDTFNHMDRQFKELKEDIDESINVNIRALNTKARQIRDLNYQIVKGEAGGPKANDLRDKRDLLIDEMSKIVNVDVIEDKRGATTISIGGRAIVAGNVVNQLVGQKNAQNQALTDVVWSDGTKVNIKNGELAGMLEARDEIVVDFTAKIDDMAKNFALKLNAQHEQGRALNTATYQQNYILGKSGVADINQIVSAGTLKVKVASTVENINLSGDATLLEHAETINTYFEDKGIEANALVFQNKLMLLSDSNLEITGGDAVNLGFSTTAPSAISPITAKEGVPFFSKPDAGSEFSARNLKLNQEIIDDVNLITASTETDPAVPIDDIIGDGSNALNIANLKYDKSMINGTTFDDYYRSEVAKLGVSTREASRMVDNQELMVAQLETKRQSVMGVSLDEEMTNMIKFQHAYNSAARYITTVDEMLDILVNRLGTFGR